VAQCVEAGESVVELDRRLAEPTIRGWRPGAPNQTNMAWKEYNSSEYLSCAQRSKVFFP